MQILRTVADLHRWRQAQYKDEHELTFVPTMGSLHAGHQSLMASARDSGGRLLVSIFVNPKQFGPGEDLDNYPRDEAGDLAKIAEVDPDSAVFLPSVEDVYPPGYCTEVAVKGLTERLCGASRPGHFLGVTTVVCRLLGLVRPTRAYFGMKDYQQLRVIQQMSRDLALGAEILGVPIVREADGLAMSSRNAYLKDDERIQALCLSRGLGKAAESFTKGEREPAILMGIIRSELASQSLVREDYIEVLDAETLQDPIGEVPLLLAAAAYVGKARLIDNRVLGA